MRRITLLLMLMATALLAASGVALAKTLIGGPGPDRIDGTRAADQLEGRGGNDFIRGYAGRDRILGQDGNDVLGAGPTREAGVDAVEGGRGNDIISTYNKPRALDYLSCGPGKDTLYYDNSDKYFRGVNPDCEIRRNRAP
jgi:Ca2+-binding RTX toxin-like protein